MIGDDRSRHRDKAYRRKLNRGKEGRPQDAALARLDRAIVGRGLDGRRAVVVLPVGYALPALQRGRMTELRVVAHRGIDIDDARLADEGIAADVDRADVNEVGLRAIAENDRVLAQDGVVS